MALQVSSTAAGFDVAGNPGPPHPPEYGRNLERATNGKSKEDFSYQLQGRGLQVHPGVVIGGNTV